MIPENVMAPTMHVACKAFIAPNSAARSPKERYTHVPRSPPPRRCILVKMPQARRRTRLDRSHLLELLPKRDILIAARDCQGSWGSTSRPLGGSARKGGPPRRQGGSRNPSGRGHV